METCTSEREIRLSRSKTQYLCGNETNDRRTVRLQGVEVAKLDEFKYLESAVQSNGEWCREVM